MLAAGFDIDPFTIVRVTKIEKMQNERFRKMHKPLGKGELECISVCASRSLVMVTNDKRAKKSAVDLGIRCFDLPEIFRAMRLKGVVDVKDLKEIIQTIESKDNIVFKNVQRLYE